MKMNPKNNYQTFEAVRALIASGEASSERAAARIIAENTGEKFATILTRLNRGKKASMSGDSRKPGSPQSESAPPAPPTDAVQVFESAQEFLEAVVKGTTPADPSRIRAAGILIRFQEVIKRAPKASPTPKTLAKRQVANEESAVIEDFEKKAAEIRRKHAERLKNGNS